MNTAAQFRDGGEAASSLPNFDGLAKIYRWLEFCTFGPLLSRCRSAFLAESRNCRKALVLGDGDGRFTRQLLDTNCQVEIEAVDASPAMLAELVRRAGPDGTRVHPHCADIRGWQPGVALYDLVVAHFFLDCLTTGEVKALAGKLSACVPSGGLWVISDFAVPEGWYGQLIARPVVWLLYRAFGAITGLDLYRLPDHTKALGEAGFVLVERRKWLLGLLISEVWTRSAASNPAMLQFC